MRIASDDLRIADAALGLDPPVTGLALSHAQQAAEKALKAYLVYHDRTFPLTHNLKDLARPFEDLDSSLLEVVRPGLDLTDFATLYRYPGEAESPDVGQARPWIESARAVVTAIEQRVKPGAR